MASYDNRQWILSLIHNAYITTDDTEFPFLAQVDDFSFQSQMEPEPHSPDISTDVEFPRSRSYTERKSERLKKEREKASRVRRITWKYNPNPDVTEAELSEMFQRKTSFARSSDTSEGEPPPKAPSLLSHLLSTSDSVNTNAFIEYSKFDGLTHNNVPTKQIDIYLYIGENPCIDYPMKVSVVSSARVLDFIGLICWLYTNQNRQPPLKSVDHYHLYIADEDGHYESEFLPLERGYIIDKYGFNTLALVEKEPPDTNQGIIVTVNFARGAFSKLEVPNAEVTLREILNKSISRRKEIAKMKEAGVDYHLEREDEPGIVLKLDKTLGQVECTEFAAVRDNSKRTNGRDPNAPNLLEVTSTQSFTVYWIQRFTKYETRIEISGNKFEIHPLPSKNQFSYHIKSLIDCSKKVSKKGKLELLITVRGEDSFKGFRFVCEPSVGEEIYEKCRYLIKMNATKSSSAKQPSFRRHNSLSLRRKTKSGGSSFEI
ncbi:Target of rapamycin complex 2 subunit MAPKAP1 [Armadillidium vulgare]|nr:Target of rapamycin complex 2 subunit MAPKAP1 [Armadillidium vulgare]